MGSSESITSKPFILTTRETFKLIWTVTVTRRQRILMLYPIFGALLIVFGILGANFASVIVGGVCMLLLPVMALLLWVRCNRASRMLEAETRAELTNTHFNHHDSLGNDSSIPWQSFSHVVLWPNYYLLYLTKKQFVILPKTAFSKAQLRDVNTLLQEKRLLK